MKHDSLVAIDIGNTNITIGAFRGGHLVKKAKVSTRAYHSYGRNFRMMLKALGHEAETRVIISSVVPVALSRVVAALNTIGKYNISILGRDITAPIRNLYRIKSEVGQDRLVNAFAARSLYGDPCAIIDFGTAITFDLVSRKGEYLGGLILPGIEMSLASLHRRTALLPRVELRKADNIIGKDTVNSIRGGILFGFGKMSDGLIAEYRKMLGGGMKTIATGGNAILIKRYSKSIQYVDEDLTLKGLFLISSRF